MRRICILKEVVHWTLKDYKRGSWSNELVVGQSPAGEKVSTEAADIIGSLTWQRLMKTQKTEKT
jgi:hypothetical protein